MTPGWIPILQPAGLMIPGQLGPTSRDLDWLWRAWWTYTVMEVVVRDMPTTVAKKSSTYPNLVLLGNALSNGDNEANLVLDGFNDCVGGGRWGNIEDSGIGLRLAHGLNRPMVRATCWILRKRCTYLLDRSKDRKTKVSLSSLLGRDTTDHTSAIRQRLFYVESTLAWAVTTSEQGRIKGGAQSFR